jgi:hypothetical protein
MSVTSNFVGGEVYFPTSHQQAQDNLRLSAEDSLAYLNRQYLVEGEMPSASLTSMLIATKGIEALLPIFAPPDSSTPVAPPVLPPGTPAEPEPGIDLTVPEEQHEQRMIVVNEIISNNSSALTEEEQATLDLADKYREGGMTEMADFLDMQVGSSILTRLDTPVTAAEGEEALAVYEVTLPDGTTDFVVVSDWLDSAFQRALSSDSFSKLTAYAEDQNPNSSKDATVTVAQVFGDMALQTHALGVYDLGIDIAPLEESIKILGQDGVSKDAHVAAVFGAFTYKVLDSGGPSGVQASIDMSGYLIRSDPAIYPLLQGVYNQAMYSLASLSEHSEGDDSADILRQVNNLSFLQQSTQTTGSESFQIRMMVLGKA